MSSEEMNKIEEEHEKEEQSNGSNSNRLNADLYRPHPKTKPSS